MGIPVERSCMCAKEEQTCSGRYNDVKLLQNQMRAYAGNHLSEEDEPAPDKRTTDPDEFLKHMSRTFLGQKAADIMACLKRSVVVVFGRHSLYLRVPSKNDKTRVLRIVIDDVHKDLLLLDSQFP